MEHAQCVATITGSTGWEGLLGGKPCLCFGNPWYAACNSCYIVSSAAECRQAIEEIVLRSSEDVELDVLRFLAYYQHRFVVSVNALSILNDGGKLETYADNLSAAIVRELTDA